MGDLQKGFTFSGNSPNNVVNAPNLNNLVDQGVVLPTLISGKPEKTAPVNSDYLLLWDSEDGTFKKVSIQNTVPQRAARTGFSGLTMRNVSGTSVSQMAITADEIVMTTSGGVPRRVTSFSVTLDMGAAVGLNGPDASGLASSGPNWIYFYAISNGTTDGAIASASSTSPTLPGGYTYFIFLGAWRLDSSSHLVLGVCRGKQYDFDIGIAANGTAATANQVPYVTTGAGVVEFTKSSVGVTNKIFAIVDVSRCVPPLITTHLRGIIGRGSSGGNNATFAMLPDSNGTDAMDATTIAKNRGMIAVSPAAPVNATSVYGFLSFIVFDIDVFNSQLFYIACDDAAQGAHWSMRITGFTLQ